MAYAGLTLYLGAAAAALAASEWPPAWISRNRSMVTLSLSVVWFAVLVFVKWELRRRRWAALRVAGIERLLAKWTCEEPDPSDLDLWVATEEARESRWFRVKRRGQSAMVIVADHIFPLKAARPVVDIQEQVYPSGLVREWRQREEKGTEARFQEGLLVLVGWGAYVVLILRTLLANAPAAGTLTGTWMKGLLN